MPTPGVKFLVTQSPFLTAPFVAAYSIRYVLQVLFRIAPSTRITLLFAMMCFPAALIINVVWRNMKETRQAAAMGAVPAPTWTAKWLGNVDRILFLKNTFKGYPGEGLGQLFEEYNWVFNMRMFWMNQITSVEPDHLKSILNTEFHNYPKGNRLFLILESYLGIGVFNSDGEVWKFHRSMLRPFFHKHKISHFECFDELADRAILKAKERLRAGYAIDFQDLITRFSTDSSTSILFGVCFDSLSGGLPYPHNVVVERVSDDRADQFTVALTGVQQAMSDRSVLGPLWPLTEIFSSRTDKYMKVLNAAVDPIIKQATERHSQIGGTVNQKTSVVAEQGETLLDHLVKETSDPKIIKDEVFNIMLAGREPISANLTFVVYMLTMYPEVLARLRKEILETLGSMRRPTYEDIKGMKYLRAVINETLRLYPPIPFNLRESIHATTLAPTTPGGKPIYVPPKTMVGYAVWLMHRRKDLWGPDAEEFDPDRFLDHRLQKYLLPRPHMFMPFNSGPRVCLGQELSYVQASFMIIRLLQNFDEFTLDSDAQPPESKPPIEWASRPGRERLEKIMPKAHLSIYCEGGLWIKMREAED